MTDEVHTRAATETEHDEIRKRIEPLTGGASLELPARADATTQGVVSPASERIRLQRPGEPELVLREGVFYTANGQFVAADQLPDWAKNSIVAASASVRRAEYVDAKMRTKNKERISQGASPYG